MKLFTVTKDFSTELFASLVDAKKHACTFAPGCKSFLSAWDGSCSCTFWNGQSQQSHERITLQSHDVRTQSDRTVAAESAEAEKKLMSIKDSYKIVGITPAGRERYLRVLVPYLLRDRHVLDEHHFWVNTKEESDKRYIKSLCEEHPDFFKYIPCSVEPNDSSTIYTFFKNCVDERTIYVRYDDDIVWVDNDATRNMVIARVENPDVFVTLGTIVNNAMCAHLMQRKGVVPTTHGIVTYDVLCDTGWNNPKFAEKLHELFLSKLEDGSHKDFEIQDWLLSSYERFSINFMSWFGKDFKKFDGVVKFTEEQWMTQEKPKELKRPNKIIGNALVSHFAFGPQRHHMDHGTNILSRYAKHSKNVSF